MKFMRIKTCCEFFRINCKQGRKCPLRKHTIETVTKTTCGDFFHWSDAVYTVLLLAGSAVLGLLLIYFVVLATSLHGI